MNVPDYSLADYLGDCFAAAVLIGAALAGWTLAASL